MPNTTQKPDKWPFKLYHGDRWPEDSFNVVDENGVPVVGYSAIMQIKSNAHNTNSVKEIRDGAGLYVNGSKRTFYTDVDISGSFVHDIQITLANGRSVTIYRGTVVIDKDVTANIFGPVPPLVPGTGFTTYTAVVKGGNVPVSTEDFNNDFNDDFNNSTT